MNQRTVREVGAQARRIRNLRTRRPGGVFASPLCTRVPLRCERLRWIFEAAEQVHEFHRM